MKDGDILLAQLKEAVAKRNKLRQLAYSLELKQIQDWVYWKDYKHANRN